MIRIGVNRWSRISALTKVPIASSADVTLLPQSSNRRRHHHSGHDDSHNSTSSAPHTALATGSAIIAFGVYQLWGDRNRHRVLAAQPVEKEQQKRRHHEDVRPDLPTYGMGEVSKHATTESLWVTFGIGVYDITAFVPEHPGSDKLMLAAGNAIDPFWHVYQQHNTPQVLALLEQYRIGNLEASERVGTEDLENPWANEPKRHPVLKPASEKPFNAEPPSELLIESYLTPNDFFYVRNHLPVPTVDIKTYEIELEIEGRSEAIRLTMDDLKQFPEHTVTATVMCGGNRRSEMTQVKPVKGLNWGQSAVGNAEWTGVRLRDVLERHGIKSDETSHVHFEGLDRDPTYTPYAASIPLSMAMNERGDVLLAYQMNGQELSRDHGYPIRAVVPGVVGARSVKWLGRIEISSEESTSHWQQNDYKGFSPSTDWDTVDFSKSPAMQNMPVTSAICHPKNGDTVKVDDGGVVTVKGYAWSGGGSRIVRVDITADGGKTWQVAELNQGDMAAGRHFGWTLWTAEVKVNEGTESVEIWSKAVDSNYNVQPETFENTWNLRGVLSHAYSRIRIGTESTRK